MWELYEEIWDQQIGNKMNIGFDFSGREIHKNDFGNPLSKYGWTLLPFGDDQYLIVNNKTMEEFPEEVDGEFVVNGKTFEIKKSLTHEGNWDINLISYETEEEIVENIYSPKNNVNKIEEEPIFEYYGEPEEELFQQEENFYYDDYVNNQNEIEDIENDSVDFQNADEFYDEDEFYDVPVQHVSLEHDKVNYAIDENKQKIDEQQKEIEELKRQIQQQHTQQLEISLKDQAEIAELKQKIEKTQILEATNQTQNELIKDLHRKLEVQNNEIKSLKKGQELQVNKLNNKIGELEKTQAFSMNKTLQNEKAINEQRKTQQFQVKNSSTREFNNPSRNNSFNKKPVNKNNSNGGKFNSFYDNTKEIDFSNGIGGYYDSIWEQEFGNKEYASDFANRIISKKDFGKDKEGGWNIDYFDPSISSDTFIASTKTIKERDGKLSFLVDKDRYIITRNKFGQWEIVKQNPKDYKDQVSSSNHLSLIANKFQPKVKREFSGEYESFSSLMINLNHFPVKHLPEFEEFLKQSTKDFALFKDTYIYSNSRAYRDRRTTISAYARVYLCTSSIKDTIKVLLFASAIKKAMNKFIQNFRNTNDLKVVSFSIVLMNHMRKLKFVQAQTNFEILRSNPIPLNIPLGKLIIDAEFNSIIKFHEFELWKKIRPFALDWHGNTYYVCDIDFDNLNIEFFNF